MKSVLIYRLGSLGDTVVALPALHLIAKTFPDAERWVLTNFSTHSKAAPMAALLGGTGLVHGYIEYPAGLRNVSKLLALRRRLRALDADSLIYLAEPRGHLRTWRDAVFFRSSGIRKLIGMPYRRDQQHVRALGDGAFEYEGARLARCLAELGDACLDDAASFDLALTASEHQAGRAALAPIDDGRPLIAASIGAKLDVKDWGDVNWDALFESLGPKLPDWGLVMLGSADEQLRTSALLRRWPGPSLNLCGNSVREMAAILSRCRIYVGHDSGPMHLSAAVGTPCVAVFSSRVLPGQWFPYGKDHRVLYQVMPCQGCGLEVCVERQKACIRSITVDAVQQAVLDIAKRARPFTPDASSRVRRIGGG